MKAAGAVLPRAVRFTARSPFFRRPLGPPRITPAPEHHDLGQLADQGLTVGYHEIVLFWWNRFGNWAENPSVISVDDLRRDALLSREQRSFSFGFRKS